jgi:1-acyl-sn-glycerol-3-phosphate acyltransferase
MDKNNNQSITQIKKEVEDDKLVNISCYCNEYFKEKDKMLYIIPCCHIVHEKCFNEYIIKNQYRALSPRNINEESKISLKCPLCNEQITTVLTETKINSKKKYEQYRIDMKSVRMDCSATINYMLLPLSIIKFTSLINKLLVANSKEDLLSTIEYFFTSFNFKINVVDNTRKNKFNIFNNQIIWKKKEDNEKKMIFISNHSSYFDSLVMYYLFRCGFISGDFITKIELGRIIASKLKLLIFKRGVDTNMVEKIKTYLNEWKKITIFPEGVMANNETILKFRTGAFYVGETICPIVIKYDKIIYDDDFTQFLFKTITQPEVIINVYINDFYNPPFNENKINKIRDKMALIGKFEKSRVSNKSLKE